MMKHRLAIVVLWAGVAAYGADPQELWEQAVKAKGGHQRLRAVHTLAVYMKPAAIVLTGPPATWLFVFPDRYFEYDGRGSGSYPFVAANGIGMADSPRSITVDGGADRVAMDANGIPRTAWHLTRMERDRLTLNQLVFLLETAWLQPAPVAAKHEVLTVEAGGRTFRLSLNKEHLPERVLSLSNSGKKRKTEYDYHLDRYREFQGVFLPTRVALTTGLRLWTWDVDYEIDAKYNPKLFERTPDLADGPEPWRRP